MVTPQRGFIAACEREQLHLSGAIQNHGAVVIVALQTGKITGLSDNLEQHYDALSEVTIGDGLPDILWQLFRQFKGAPLWFASELIGVQGELDVVLSPVGKQQVALELLPSKPTRELRSAISVIPNSITSEQQLTQTRQLLVDYIAELSGFERTMYYHFLPSGDGEVIAENCAHAQMGSYLQLRFPASDIPQIARQLYLKNPWRCIYDAEQPTAAIIAESESSPDLTHCLLRSVSPVHIHYMHNMGVRSSVSWPIAGKDDLLALLSIHDSQAKALPYALLKHFSEIIERFNYLLREYRAQVRMNLHDRLQKYFNQFTEGMQKLSEDEQTWQQLAKWLISEFDVDGVMLQTPTQQLSFGLKPEANVADLVAQHMQGQGELVWMSDNVAEQLPGVDLTQVAGLAVIRTTLVSDPKAQLFLCRQPELYQVAWGGRPDKPLERDNPDMPISPRRSFEKWIETRYSFSKPWDENMRVKLMKLRLLLNEIG